MLHRSPDEARQKLNGMSFSPGQLSQVRDLTVAPYVPLPVEDLTARTVPSDIGCKMQPMSTERIIHLNQIINHHICPAAATSTDDPLVNRAARIDGIARVLRSRPRGNDQEFELATICAALADNDESAFADLVFECLDELIAFNHPFVQPTGLTEINNGLLRFGDVTIDVPTPCVVQEAIGWTVIVAALGSPERLGE